MDIGYKVVRVVDGKLKSATSRGFIHDYEIGKEVVPMKTKLSKEEFEQKHPEYQYLLERLFEGEVEWEKVKTLPGITKKKLETLLKKHREARKVD